HDEGSSRDGAVATRGGKIAGKQRHLERAGNVEYIDLLARDKFEETIERAVDDLGVPACFDEGIAGVCHRNHLSCNGHVTQGDHEPFGGGCRSEQHVLFHPDCNRRPRHRTWSADPSTEGARGLAAIAAYRRWGISPRPENRAYIGKRT